MQPYNVCHLLARPEVHALGVLPPATEIPERRQQRQPQDHHQHGEHGHEGVVVPDTLVRSLGRSGGGRCCGGGGGRSGGGGRGGGCEVADLHGAGGREGGGAKVPAAHLQPVGEEPARRDR